MTNTKGKQKKGEKFLDIPSAIINSDDELMGIQIDYSHEKDTWRISYADEGSSLSVVAGSLNEAVKKIRAKHLEVYKEDIWWNSNGEEIK